MPAGGVCGTLAAEILIEVGEAVSSISSGHGLPVPQCVLVVVGEHPAAAAYARSTAAAARVASVGLKVVQLDEDIEERALISELEALNRDDAVHGARRPAPCAPARV